MRLVYFLAFYSFLKCQMPPRLSWQKHIINLPPPIHPLYLSVFIPLLTFHSNPLSTDGTLNVVSKHFSHWGLQFSQMDSLLGVTHHYGCIIPGVVTLNGVSSTQTITIVKMTAYRRKLFRPLQLRGSLALCSQAGTTLCVSAGITMAKLMDSPGLDWPGLVLGNYLALLWAPCSSKKYSQHFSPASFCCHSNCPFLSYPSVSVRL